MVDSIFTCVEYKRATVNIKRTMSRKKQKTLISFFNS